LCRILGKVRKQTKNRRNAMRARLFGTIALVMLPTLAFAADAGNTGTVETKGPNQAAPDNAKAAGTGGGKGAAEATSTATDNPSTSGNVGANGAAAATAKAPISPDKATAAGDGGGKGAKTSEPSKTP
jgi:hypothetical protein